VVYGGTDYASNPRGMPVNILQTLDAHQRFPYSLLNDPTKQIRLAQIRPSQDEHSTVQLVIKHVNLSEYVETRFLKHQEGCNFLDFRKPERPPALALANEFENQAAILEFQALSYTLGAVALVTDVYVESHDGQGWFAVRENLNEILINQRHKTRPSAWLWIDQICINQGDETEKGRQVALMSEIYLRAAEVTV
jgi:hypothetical protein